MADSLPVRFDDVVAAARRLRGIAHLTPVRGSRTVDERTGTRAFFKCENLQRAGAFKIRGAYNALHRLQPDERAAGVIAYSSGNHAQAIALAGRLLEVPVTVVMPEDAPEVKLEATRGYGAEVVTYDPATTVREELGARLAQQRGLTLVPPFDHPDIVAGQGTVALETIRQVGPLDGLLVPCGGGGLLSGCAIVAKAASPGCRVIGVEPAAGDDATRSFRTGDLQRVEAPDTIADGARTPSLGEVTFPIVMARVDEMVTVEDAALVRTMRFLLERTKMLVEPTGALAAAALLEGAVDVEGRVGVVVSGGNVDTSRVAAWLRER